LSDAKAEGSVIEPDQFLRLADEYSILKHIAEALQLEPARF